MLPSHQIPFQTWLSILVTFLKNKCRGFSYIGQKLFNMVPKNVKDAKITNDFKKKTEKMDMGKHPLIFQLAIKSDIYYVYLFILLLFESFVQSLLKVLMDKANTLTFQKIPFNYVLFKHCSIDLGFEAEIAAKFLNGIYFSFIAPSQNLTIHLNLNFRFDIKI